MFKPLAKGDEPYRWVNEAKLAPGVIYVLKRAELEIRLADLFLSAECEHEQASTNLGNHHRRGASMAQTYDPVAKLNELIKGIEFAMLTTIRPSGRLHSCPMATTEAEGDGVLWFFSGNNTEKVEAIKTDPRVNLAYSDASSQRYVSITGNAEPVRDHVKAKELWKPLYNAWFPMGLQDPNLILLKVNIQVAEYWDATAGSMVLLAGFAN
jgi:general stress protein 26